MMTHTVPCPSCQKPVKNQAVDCPGCGAPLGTSSQKRAQQFDDGQVRRGLLAMLLGTAYYFFAAGYSAWDFPYAVEMLVTESFTLTLSLCGLGLVALDTLHSFAPSWSDRNA